MKKPVKRVGKLNEDEFEKVVSKSKDLYTKAGIISESEPLKSDHRIPQIRKNNLSN